MTLNWKGFTLNWKGFTLYWREFTLKWKEFTLKWKEFTFKWKEFILNRKEFTFKWKGFTFKWKGFTFKWKGFNFNLKVSACDTGSIRSSYKSFSGGLVKTSKPDLLKRIYLPPETITYETYILDQPLPHILHLSRLWHCSFHYD